MTSYVGSTTHTFEFDGEKITYKLKPLLIKDSFKLRELARVSDYDYLTGSMGVVPTYLETIDGPHDAAGRQIPFEEFSPLHFFIPLTSDIIKNLMQEGAVKNPQRSSEPSAESSLEQTPATTPSTNSQEDSGPSNG